MLTIRRVMAFAVIMMMAFAVCSPAWSADFINSTQGYGAGVWFTSLYGDLTYTNKLSLRGDLNLKQATALNVDAEWRLDDKWGLDANYFSMETNGDQFINRNTTFNGCPIVRGDRLHGKINLTTLSFMLNYNIARTEDSTMNVMVGARYMDLNVNIRKDPSIVPGFNFSLHPSASMLPVIGLSGKQRVAERIYLFGNFNGMFDVGTGNIKNANLYDFRAGVRWNFQEPGWYTTFEYRAFGTRVSRTDNTSSNLYWNGPAVTVRYEF